MMTPPAHPKIYHITHVDNLASIVTAGCIEADGRRVNAILGNVQDKPVVKIERTWYY